MRTVQGKRLARLRAVQDFLDDHADRLPGLRGNNARRRFKEIVDEVEQHCVRQEASRLTRLALTRQYQALRTTLLEHHVAPIVAMARSVLVPGVHMAFIRMPRGNASAPMLAAAVGGLAESAARHERAFIDGGLPEGFLARLHDAVDAMTAADTRRASLRGARLAATSGIARTLSDADTVVRVLGTLVRAAMGGDARLVDGWHAVAEPRRLAKGAASASRRAVPPGGVRGALPAPSMKRLGDGTSSATTAPDAGANTLGSLLKPLGRLFRAS